MKIRAERTAKDLVLRPRAAAGRLRLHATLRGAKFYEGRPCQRCGDKYRYVSNSHCIGCKGQPQYSRAQSNRMRDYRARAALATPAGGSMVITLQAWYLLPAVLFVLGLGLIVWGSNQSGMFGGLIQVLAGLACWLAAICCVITRFLI